MSELKPCPFCGGEAAYENRLHINPIMDESGASIGIEVEDYEEWVQCKKCGVKTLEYFNAREAVEVWNRRVEDE